jgi:F0F1-type ATP synthase assembly protein I
MTYDNVKETTETTIKRFGKLPHIVVLLVAVVFAVAPSTLALYQKPTSYSSLSAISPFLAVWIPFCCLTIPVIYYLCREILNLRKRVEDLEKKINS